MKKFKKCLLLLGMLYQCVTASAQQGGPKANFTVNNEAVSIQKLSQFFTCNPLILKNITSGVVKFYKVDITDETFKNVVYSTGYVAGNPKEIDLLNMCDKQQGTCTSLNPGSTGNYGVTLWVSSCCPADVSMATSSSYSGILALSPSIVGGNPMMIMTTIKNSNVQDRKDGANTNVATPHKVGRLSADFHLLDPMSNKTYVGSYLVSLKRWNEALGTWDSEIWSQNFVNGNSVVTPYHISIGALGVDGFFADPTNAPDQSIWKIDVTLKNLCGTYGESEIFQIDDVNHN